MANFKQVYPRHGDPEESKVGDELDEGDYIIWNERPYSIEYLYQSERLDARKFRLSDICTFERIHVDIGFEDEVRYPTVHEQRFELEDITDDGTLILKNPIFEDADSKFPDVNASPSLVECWKETRNKFKTKPFWCPINRARWTSVDGQRHELHACGVYCMHDNVDYGEEEDEEKEDEYT